MTFRVAINGYGRIGRNILRAWLNSQYLKDISIVAINDLSDPEINAHLTRYDTVHGPLNKDVSLKEGSMVVDGHRIHLSSCRDPKDLPWRELNIDCVFECTGFFASKEKAAAHLQAGAKQVLVSAPAGSDVPTVVYGVNHDILKADDTVVSNASCTTNCLAPVVSVLEKHIGIESGLMTTIHAYTNDQCLTDTAHKDLRRARSATQSMIPTKTGAAKAVGLVLPELDGKLDGYAIRVPTINVSVVDLTFQAKKATSVEAINAMMQEAAEGPLMGVLAYNTLPLVSCDFNHHPASSIFDATQTRVLGNTVKVVSWYDNEWGFSNRMLDTANELRQKRDDA